MRKQVLSFAIALLSVIIIHAQNIHLSEDFNGATLPAGWNNSAVTGVNSWSFGLDGSSTNPGMNNLDSTAMAYFDDDNLTSSAASSRAELVTSAFNNLGSPQTFLRFDYNFRQLPTPSDSFIVAVFDGTNWVDVFNRTVDDCGNYFSACSLNIPTATVDISAYANAVCQIRFSYYDGNDWAWYVGIDNIEVYSPFPNDIGVTQVIDPSSGCGLTNAETLNVKINNFGSVAATGFDVVFDINNGTQTITETITASIPSGDSLTYTFTGTGDFSAIGVYSIKAYTNLLGDQNRSNDTTLSQIEQENSFTPTFTDNFEGPNQWKVVGQNPSWELGVPSNSVISAATSGTKAYVTNLNGLYNNSELSYLISPCFDFGAANGDPIVTFNMNYFTEGSYDSLAFESSIDNGLTWQKVYPSANPTNWYNVGQHWEGRSIGWVPVENILTGLAGQSSVKFRFKLQTDGNGSREGVGIDDFSIRYPQPYDISVNAILYPSTNGTPLCGLGNENIIIEIENKGANPIDTVDFSYRINNGTVFTDRLIATIQPNAVRTFTFPTKYNFVGSSSYDLDIWGTTRADGFRTNDSLLNRTLLDANVAVRTIPLRENFNGTGWVNGNGNPNGNSILSNGWSRNPSATGFNVYTWHVWNTQTGAFQTGPSTGRGGTGKFIHIASNGGNAGATASFISPCFDLSTKSGAIVEFWYHKFGTNMPTLSFDVYDGSQWINGVGQVLGQTQTAMTSAWQKLTVNLNQYAGRRIKVRFRTTKTGFGRGDVAIDDFEIFEPIAQDGKVLSLISPTTGCSPDGSVIVELENFGSTDLTNIPVAFNINGGTTIRDTARITLTPGARFNFTFAINGNFSKKGETYVIDAFTEVVGDSNLFNDHLITSITNTTRDPDYVEDFESFIDGSCANATNANAGDVLGNGWIETSTNTNQWHVQDAGACGGTGSNGTGPSTDHTLGTGNFMFTEGSGATGIASMISPCIDFTQGSGAAMKFWYHMFGSAVGDIIIDVIANGITYNGIYTISGQQQISETSPWQEAIVKFNQFGGDQIQIRIRATKLGGFASDMAIDDISFFAPKGKDARMLAVTGPESGCLISDKSILSVDIDNFGTLPINPDSLLVYYQVDNGPIVKDTVDVVVMPEQQINFTFTQTTDLSIQGKRYNIKTWTGLIGEEDVSNDTIFMHEIRNQTKITNYFETFERFRDSKCDQQLGQVLENGWFASTNSSYNWQVQSTTCGQGSRVTPTPNTGPSGDRTSGTGIFIFTEGNGSGTANFSTPCIDLTNNVNPRMSFFYHRYGSQMNALNVDVLVNGTSNLGVATLTGQNQTSASDVWKNLVVDLTPYAGELIEIRFRSVKTLGGSRSDMAIDDFFLYEATTKDAGITEIISPNGDACGLTSGSFQVNIENFGTTDIPADSLFVAYTNNNGLATIDTIDQIITAGSNLIYTFDSLIDLSAPGVQNLRAFTIYKGDTLTQNNVATKSLENRSPGIPRYFMDFERHEMGANSYSQDNLRGFTRFPVNGNTGTWMWHVQCGPGPYVDGQPNVPPAGPPTGPSGDHTYSTNERNGKGCYMLMESDLQAFENMNLSQHPLYPDATLELPCGPMDFSNSENGSILLTYWYHMFGPETGNLFVDVHNGTNWVLGVNVIRGPQMGDDTDPWKLRQVVLNQFVGNPTVKIRFRAEEANKRGYTGQGRGGDIGIDDVEILDRKQRDASMFALIDPSTDCMLGASEDLKVRIQNLGVTDIIQLNVGYQIIFTPLNGDPIALPIKKDTVVGQSIIPLAFYDFTFNQSIDMSASGSYEFIVWTEYINEQNKFNDTIREKVINVTRPFPSCENFSGLVFDDIAKDFKDGVFTNGWAANDGTPYSFKASIQGTPDDPNLKGHTGGLNDIFMLAFDGDGMPGQEATLTSPCWDLTATPAANLEFYYIMPAGNGNLLVEARQVGGGWDRLDTILENTLVWTKRSIVLADYVGQFTEFRLTSTNTGAYYAIDDFCVIKPLPQQIALQPIVSPLANLCFYSNSERVVLRYRNVGIDNIDSFAIVMTVDKDIISNPRGNYFRDTIWIYPGAALPYFEPGDRFTISIDSLGWDIDMSDRTDYFFSIITILPGDVDLEDNNRIDYQINHPIPRELPYLIDFEKLPVAEDDLIIGPPVGNPPYLWALKQGIDIAGRTGPGKDHTISSDSSGTYLVSQSAGGQLGDAIVVTSPCVNLQQALAPEIKYWYYMFGVTMGDLYLQINDDFGWVTVDQLLGEERDQATGQTNPWKSRIVKLPQYVGKVVRYRFVSVRGSGTNFSNMAIDDISVYDQAAIDVSPVSLAEPNRDSTYCYAEKNPMKINLINNGSNPLDLSVDTACVTVIVNKDNQGDGVFVPIDTLFSKIFVNTFGPLNNDITPRDSIVTVTMDSTFNMSDTGSVYRFIVSVKVDGDFIVNNDLLDEQILSQRKTGQIIDFVLPLNDTICFGSPLLISNRNNFGALGWEEKRIGKNGLGTWTPGLTGFPFNEQDYQPQPDTTYDFRVRVCPQLFISEGIDETTNPIRIEVVKPWTPTGFSGNRCINETTPDVIYATAVDNITAMNFYDSLTSTSPILFTDNTPPVIPGGFFEYPLPGQLNKTDTFFVASVIALPNVQTLNGQGITCTSLVRDTSVFVISDTAKFDLGIDRTVCQDTSIVLDAGQDSARGSVYEWIIYLPDGTVVRDSITSQTLVIDAYLLDVNATYGYELKIVTDSGCTVPSRRVNITIIDSCLTSVSEIAFKETFGIYPNPVSDQLNITHKSLENFKGSIRLLSSEGQLIEEFENIDFGNLDKQINMGTLPKGVYIIKVTTEKGSFIEKVIKN